MRIRLCPVMPKSAALAVVIIIVIMTAAALVLPPANPSPANRPAPKVVLPQPLKDFEDFGLKIKKLKISVPIIPEVDGFDEAIYYDALLKGVGQFKGSKNPDQDGNLFVFGHSSYSGLGTGDYKEIFKNINELSEGDEIEILYKKKPYYYKISQSYEAYAQDWSLLDPTPKDEKDRTVTLMTCWPIGETAKRWGIIAKQI